MNLHRVAAGIVAAINPLEVIQIQISAGYTTNSDGKRVPSYHPPFQMYGQVQALTNRDLRMLDSLNIQGSQKTIYISGSIEGITRLTQKGGDLITFCDNSHWLTTMVIERWKAWCKVSVTLQIDGP